MSVHYAALIYLTVYIFYILGLFIKSFTSEGMLLSILTHVQL